MTAYFGLLDVGKMKEGDVVVVSGAAGATGSTVGQIARIKGAGKVIGIAGGKEKCSWIVDDLGFDAAVDYKGRTSPPACTRRPPTESTCTSTTSAGRSSTRASPTRDEGAGGGVRGDLRLQRPLPMTGPANYINLIRVRGRMEGFLILDYFDRLPAAQAEMGGWLAEGKLKSAEHVVEGLDRAPEALNLLFTGGNIGKVIVKV